MPLPDGVNTPAGVMVPPVAVHVTLLLKAPVPLTVAEQVEVLSEVMEDGFAVTAIPVTVTGGGRDVVLMDAEPDLLLSCVDVAAQVPTPGPDGVKTPPGVMAPPVAVHVTPLL